MTETAQVLKILSNLPENVVDQYKADQCIYICKECGALLDDLDHDPIRPLNKVLCPEAHGDFTLEYTEPAKIQLKERKA